MEALVVVKLVDFTIQNDDTCDNSTNGLSSEFENYHLISLLKKGLYSKFRKFSLDCIQVRTLERGVSCGYSYGIVISDDYNKLIINEGNRLIVYDRSTSAETIESKPLFSVDYYVPGFRCMKLVKEMGSEFIYTTIADDSIVKIRVSDLMKKEATFVWQSTTFFNVWGLDIILGKVYSIQYFSPEIVVLDCQSGQVIQETDLPNTMNGFGIHFLSETEMLTSFAEKLELFQKQKDGKWESIRTRSLPSAYSIFYEDLSDLVYVAASSKSQVFVVNSFDFSVVKVMEGFPLNYGMVVDKKSGLLYLSDTVGNTVMVYK